jgi:hypothetical protein
MVLTETTIQPTTLGGRATKGSNSAQKQPNVDQDDLSYLLVFYLN